MFELKTKIVKHLQVKGNKCLNEKNLKILFKNVGKNSKKTSTKLIQILIGHSCLIFKTTKVRNISKPYYFKNSVRISFAIKQNLKLIINQKKTKNALLTKLENFKTTNQISEKKLFYCYRWFF